MIQSSKRPALELADILRAHGAEYRRRHRVSPEQAAVLTQLMQCRTAVLGGHLDRCGSCGLEQISYNSCRNRHCPKCQASKRAAWVEARLERVLPVPHFHVVFTLPKQLHPLVLRNRRTLYALLFEAASAALLELAADPRRLGAQIGFTAILHTWGQSLLFHPHLHCVVTGGGLSPDGQRWLPARPRYLLPVKALGRLFRGKFLAGLKRAYQCAELVCRGSTAHLAEADAFENLLRTLYACEWVVYAKPPFGGVEQVYRYLGRYTHRVAISNARLVAHEDGHVVFHWKDYADGSQTKQMRLTALEFLRRFLLHVLPKRFVRIRHYGLLASRNVAGKLARCRELLAPPAKEPSPEPVSTQTAAQQGEAAEANLAELRRCPNCGAELVRYPFSGPRAGERGLKAPLFDSS